MIIPSYNCAGSLPDSVGSVLAQTLQPIEVIVVDDGSSDDTASVCARFPPLVRYLRKINGGVSSARNAGIREARGDLIAFLDADDVWRADKLEVQQAVHLAFPGVGWSITNHRTTDLLNRELPGVHGFERDFPLFRDVRLSAHAFFARSLRRSLLQSANGEHVIYVGDVYRLLFDGNFVFPSCAMVRHEVALRAGWWDETFRVANDTEWFHRVAAAAPAAVIMTPLLSWRRGRADTLMQGRNIADLVGNAMISIDRALTLRGDPDNELRCAHAAARRRLLLRLAYGQLSLLDGRGVRSSLLEARRSGARLSMRMAAMWAASWLPRRVLLALHAVRNGLRRASGGGDGE